MIKKLPLKINPKLLALHLILLLYSCMGFTDECVKNKNCNNIKINKLPEPNFLGLNNYLELIDADFHTSMNSSDSSLVKSSDARNKILARHSLMDNYKTLLEEKANQQLKAKGLEAIDYKKEEKKVLDENHKYFNEFYAKRSLEEKKLLNQLFTTSSLRDQNNQLKKDSPKLFLTIQEKALLNSALIKLNRSITKEVNPKLGEEKIIVNENDTYIINTIHSANQSIFEIISHRYILKVKDLISD